MASPPSFLYPQPRTTSTEDLSQRAQNGKVSEPFLFSGVEFRRPLNLSTVTFEKGVEFRRCIFHEPVDFSGAHFRGFARFWKSIFKEPADFRFAAFEKLEQGAFASTENGEANFSWSRFEANADFLWTHFEGPAFFWRTIFEKFAKLEATFKSSAIFEGNPRLVSIERTDLRSYSGLFDGLNLAGLLSQDGEDHNCAILSIPDQNTFEEKLRRVGFNADSIHQVRSALVGLQAGVFSGDGASFCGAHFAEPEAVTFRNIDLQACRFADSNAGRAKFQNVRWDRQPTVLWAAHRRAVCDERSARSRSELSVEELRALGTLYNDLRVSHEERGLFDDAIDFQYGEMETKRLNQSILLRHISLLAWYRHLSAYGARPGLALFWLLVGIFVLFPVLYFLTGYSHHPIDVIVHSLETSTFLEAWKGGLEPAKSTPPIAPRFVAGFERLAIAFQAALFGLAVQHKFGRK